jgi:hypothetical protein
MEEKTSQCGDLIIKATVKKKPRFKAGAELSSRVNLKSVEVNVNDTSTEDTDAFEIMMHFKGCIVENRDYQSVN